MERNNVTAADIDLFVSHQANRRIIMSAAERLGLPPEKVIINIEKYGNTTAGTIPLALTDAVADGRLKKGTWCCSPRSAPGLRSVPSCFAGRFERSCAAECGTSCSVMDTLL